MTRQIVLISFLVVALTIGGTILAVGGGEKAPPAKGMVRIPGGTFLMGCSPGDVQCVDVEQPAHRVTLDGYHMDATPTTNAQYQRCVAAGGCAAIDANACTKWNGTSWQRGPWMTAAFQGTDQPVVCVTWEQAAAYCQWAGKRLPTEAEWEFAARAGTTGPRYGDPDAIAWHSANADGATHTVGRKKPNAYELYDMLGNVAEWCADWCAGEYYRQSPANNPKGPQSAGYTLRVVRGGCWGDSAANLRVSSRMGRFHGDGNIGIGFRCARD
jgi:formylglycine-generating enzyme required for sulfatase activity